MKEVMIRIKGKQVTKDSGEDEMELGKYSDAISHTCSLQTKKQLSFYLNHRIF